MARRLEEATFVNCADRREIASKPVDPKLTSRVPVPRRIVQIVPLLPPPFEGLGGYALALARFFASSHGIPSAYVVGLPSWCGTTPGDVVAVAERSGEGLAEALAACSRLTGRGHEATAVVLHYVNYGYQKRGCPVWLLRGLARWREEAPGQRLVTVFHEVYAFGPPWRSSFWLSPVQRRLAARLARMSDGVVTPLSRYAGSLRRWRPGLPSRVLPVFSTVGEPETLMSYPERKPIMVTFGGPGSRERAYGPYRSQLDGACRALGIERLIDIGPAISSVPASVSGRPVESLGTLPAEEVSARLQEAQAGFLAYPPGFLGKSSVFAAYSAHGLPTVVAWDGDQATESVRRGVHYLTVWELAEDADSRSAHVAIQARAWYLEHSLRTQADVYSELLFGDA